MAETQTERAHDRSDQPGESPHEYLDRYGRMRLIRRFEEDIQRLFLKGEVHGTTHLSAGQEAVPVGVCSALEPDDYVAGTYRGHGHALAKGTDPEALAAEMLGRITGVCGGRAGSMNVIDLENGLVGCFGIVGGSIAAATGAAISAQRQGRVAVAFFGDGASNQGYFHECLNWAQVFDLPVVYVCENNFYGEFTPMASVTAGGEIGIRAASFGMQSQVVDGNDLWAVREAALDAVERARSGAGPTLLECQTYRHFGHSKSDPGSTGLPTRWSAGWHAIHSTWPARGCSTSGSATRNWPRRRPRSTPTWTARSRARSPRPIPDPARDGGTEFKE